MRGFEPRRADQNREEDKLKEKSEEGRSADVAELLETAARLIEKANAEYRSVVLPCGSRALAFAMEAGLPPQMSYTVAETAAYTGISAQTLYDEAKAGRIALKVPYGQTKGKRILVTEVDRWMEA